MNGRWGVVQGPTPTYVYRIFDRSGDLLYVGQSIDVERRLSAHRSWTRSYPDHHIVVDGPYTPAMATVVERRAILCEVPARNKSWRFDSLPTLAYCLVLNATVAYRYLAGREALGLEAAMLLYQEFGIRPVPADSGVFMYQLLELEHRYLASRGELPAGLHHIERVAA